MSLEFRVPTISLIFRECAPKTVTIHDFYRLSAGMTPESPDNHWAADGLEGGSLFRFHSEVLEEPYLEHMRLTRLSDARESDRHPRLRVHNCQQGSERWHRMRLGIPPLASATGARL
jgi:hypothetical protein